MIPKNEREKEKRAKHQVIRQTKGQRQVRDVLGEVHSYDEFEIQYLATNYPPIQTQCRQKNKPIDRIEIDILNHALSKCVLIHEHDRPLPEIRTNSSNILFRRSGEKFPLAGQSDIPHHRPHHETTDRTDYRPQNW